MIEFDFFEFDGALVEELYEMLDPKLAILKAYINDDYPEEFDGHDTIEHIRGVASVAAQRFITVTCAQFNVDWKDAQGLGAVIGNTTKIAAIYAAANFWKHSEDDPNKLRAGTKRTLEAAGIDFVKGHETRYLVGNIFYRCGYATLKDIISDLKSWTQLVIEKAQRSS